MYAMAGPVLVCDTDTDREYVNNQEQLLNWHWQQICLWGFLCKVFPWLRFVPVGSGRLRLTAPLLELECSNSKAVERNWRKDSSTCLWVIFFSLRFLDFVWQHFVEKVYIMTMVNFHFNSFREGFRWTANLSAARIEMTEFLLCWLCLCLYLNIDVSILCVEKGLSVDWWLWLGGRPCCFLWCFF